MSQEVMRNQHYYYMYPVRADRRGGFGIT